MMMGCDRPEDKLVVNLKKNFWLKYWPRIAKRLMAEPITKWRIHDFYSLDTDLRFSWGKLGISIWDDPRNPALKISLTCKYYSDDFDCRGENFSKLPRIKLIIRKVRNEYRKKIDEDHRAERVAYQTKMAKARELLRSI